MSEHTRINIRLSMSLKERAKAQSDSLGCSLSSYLAILIGEGVKKREHESVALTSAINASIKKLDGFSEDDLSAEMIAKIMEIYESSKG